MTITEDRTRTAVTVEVKATELRRVLATTTLFVGAKDSLPVLQSVRLEGEDGTLTAIATDRYTLATDTAPYDSFDDVKPAFVILVTAADCERVIAAIKQLKANAEHATATITMPADGDPTVTLWDTTLRLETVLGEFPKWRGLLMDDPKEPVEMTTVGLNPSRLARYAKVGTLSGMKAGHAVMRVTFHSVTKPCRVRVGETFDALEMPVRLSEAR